jgi:hypothetical protein
VKTDSKGMKSIDYSRFSVIIVQAFKEQQQIILNQQESISRLSEENKLIKQELLQINEMKSELEKLKTSIQSNSVK